jgi:tetratricopeptide (TPR) repeat protein
MCLGESTTEASPGSYPPQLEEILNQRNIGIKFSVINKGQASVNTSYIVEHLEENLNRIHPDMVITMIGINDYGWHMPKEYGLPGYHLSFLESLRIYKLIRYLWLHILFKFNMRNIKEVCFTPNKCYAEEYSYVQSGVLNKNSSTSSVINEEEYSRKAFVYFLQGKNKEAEIIFKKIIEFNPKSYQGYIGLALSYYRQHKDLDSELAYKKAIELEPKKPRAYIELGLRYYGCGKYEEAVEIFKKAIDFDTPDLEATFLLGWAYKMLGKDQESKKCFKQVVTYLNPNDNDACVDQVFGKLAVLYKELGQTQLAEKYYAKANNIRQQSYNPRTRDNYLKIKQILDSRGIRFVCVQYPVRSVKPLKSIFNNYPGVIFVDNEQVFKDALNKEGYKEYFHDIFGGDFGHCTKKGNHLLAENIANVILREVFHR